MLTCLHAYMLTCLHAYLLACLRTRMLTCLYAWTLAWYMLTANEHSSYAGNFRLQLTANKHSSDPRTQWPHIIIARLTRYRPLSVVGHWQLEMASVGKNPQPYVRLPQEHVLFASVRWYWVAGSLQRNVFALHAHFYSNCWLVVDWFCFPLGLLRTQTFLDP